MPLPLKAAESSSRLPMSIDEAADCAESSEFIKKYIPANILEEVIAHSRMEWKEYSTAYDKDVFEKDKYFYSL